MSGAICRQYAPRLRRSRVTQSRPTAPARDHYKVASNRSEAASFDLESGKVCVNSQAFLWRKYVAQNLNACESRICQGGGRATTSDVNPACAYSSNDRTESYN